MPKRDLIVTLVGVNKTDRAFGKALSNTQQLGHGLLGFGAAASAGFGGAVLAASNFDSAMSGVQAVAGATAGEMAKLSDAALKAGADTVFSASDAARAEAELTKAGVSVSDVLGGALTGSLDLASAGQIDLADSAMIAAQAMNIFDLRGQDVAHIADVLAAGANKSAADVGTLGEAMRQGGLVAAQTGLSFEDTVGALSAFADAGLVGSDAGTSLKTALQRLNPTSDKAAALMQELGLTAYDAQGNFVGLQEYAGRLQKGLGGLTEEQRNSALATIFGSDAVRAASVLYKLGADGVDEYVEAVNDQGAASRMAATQLDNLKGDVEALKGSLETALIQSGSKANGVLRFMAKEATGAVNAFSEAPGPVQAAATAVAGVAGAGGLAAGALLTLAPRIHATNTALDQMGRKGAIAKGALAGFGKGAGAVAGIALVSEAVGILQDQLDKATGDGPAELDKLGTSLKALAIDGEVGGEALRIFGTDLDKFGQAVKEVGDRSLYADLNRAISVGFKGSFEDAAEDVGAVDEALAGLVSTGRMDLAAKAFDRLATAAAKNGVSTKEVRTALPEYAAALDDVAVEARLAGEEHINAADKIRALGTDAAGAAGDVAELTEAQKDLRDSLAGFIDPMDAWSEALSDNEEAERDRASKVADSANKSAQARVDALQTERDAFSETAREQERIAEDQLRSARDRAEGRKGAARAPYEAEVKAAEERLRHLKRSNDDHGRALDGQAKHTRDALSEQNKSWEDYAHDVEVSIDDVIRKLQGQVTAQNNWERNMSTLAGKVSVTTLEELRKLGVEGAPLVQALVTSSDAKMREFDRLMQEKSGAAVENAAAAIEAKDKEKFAPAIKKVTGPHTVKIDTAEAERKLTEVADKWEAILRAIAGGAYVADPQASADRRHYGDTSTAVPGAPQPGSGLPGLLMPSGAAGPVGKNVTVNVYPVTGASPERIARETALAVGNAP